MTNSLLILAAVCALTQAEATPPTPAAAAAATPAAASQTPAPAVDLEADSPPPSAWDRKRAANEGSDATRLEEQSLLGQVGRTLFGLLVVVGLIYILGKIAIAKLGKAGSGGRGGKNLKVVERLQLDQRNAVFMVQVEDGPLLLLGSSEKGVQLITELDPDAAPATSPARSFSDAMAEASQRNLDDEREPVDIAAKGTG